MKLHIREHTFSVANFESRELKLFALTRANGEEYETYASQSKLRACVNFICSTTQVLLSELDEKKERESKKHRGVLSCYS